MTNLEQLIQQIKAPNLRAVAEYAALDLINAILLKEDEIAATTVAAEKDARDNDSEGPVKIGLGFKIAWNLDKSTVTTTFGFSSRTEVKNAHSVDTSPRLL
jgi:hypothetical protein